MDPSKGLAVLGFKEGSVRSREDLDKVRQRSKELYKRYAADKTRQVDAKRVCEAFDAVKLKYEKRFPPASKAASDAPKASGSGSAPQLPTKRSHSDLTAATSRDAAERDAKRRQAALESLGRTASAESLLGRTASNASTGSRGAPGLARTVSLGAHGVPLARTASSKSLGSSLGNSSGRAKDKRRLAGNQTAIFSKGGDMVLGAVPPKPTPAATPQRPAPAPAPGKVPPKQGAVLVCKCGQSFKPARAMKPEAAKEAEPSCPACRMRAMDPMNPMLEAARGLLKLLVLQPPLLPPNAKQEAKLKFTLNLPRLQQWRKEKQNVEVRMVSLDNFKAHQTWPNSLTFQVNDRKVFEITEGLAGHKRRDLPRTISAELKSGPNKIEVTVHDTNVQKYALAVVRSQAQTVRDLVKRVPVKNAEESKQRVVDLLFHSMLEGSGTEVQVEGHDRSRLICPITLARIDTPARGVKCGHLQCFDLSAYLVSNMRMKVVNSRWHCPICDIRLQPPKDLFIDAYVLKVLADAEANAEEVQFDTLGEWKVSATAASDVSDSEAEAEPTAPNGGGNGDATLELDLDDDDELLPAATPAPMASPDPGSPDGEDVPDGQDVEVEVEAGEADGGGETEGEDAEGDEAEEAEAGEDDGEPCDVEDEAGDVEVELNDEDLGEGLPTPPASPAACDPYEAAAAAATEDDAMVIDD